MARKVDFVGMIPQVLQADEIKALLLAEEPTYSDLWEACRRYYEDMFVQTANLTGVEKWEEMIGITPSPSQSLDDRKDVILFYIRGNRPYTYRFLEQYLDDNLGVGKWDIVTDFNNYWIYINFDFSLYHLYYLIRDRLREIIPANMGITLNLRESNDIDISVKVKQGNLYYQKVTVRNKVGLDRMDLQSNIKQMMMYYKKEVIK